MVLTYTKFKNRVELISSVVVRWSGDVSIVGDVLIMSVEQTRSRLDCGLTESQRKPVLTDLEV